MSFDSFPVSRVSCELCHPPLTVSQVSRVSYVVRWFIAGLVSRVIHLFCVSRVSYVIRLICLNLCNSCEVAPFVSGASRVSRVLRLVV